MCQDFIVMHVLHHLVTGYDNLNLSNYNLKKVILHGISYTIFWYGKAAISQHSHIAMTGLDLIVPYGEMNPKKHTQNEQVTEIVLP